MTMSRISTITLQQSTINNALRVQSDIFKSQQQISTGVKAQTFSELSPGEVETLTAVENRLGKSDQYTRNNNQLLTRVDSTSNVLSEMIDLANSMKNLILQRRNGSLAGSLAFEQQVRSNFESAALQMNTNVDGRYLFAGARTNQAPVDPTDFPTPFEEGVPDASYYQGSTEDLTARVEDGNAITYNIRGDAEAFQKLMAGFRSALDGHTEDNDEKLSNAYALMQGAVDGLINLQSQNGATRLSITEANTRHEGQKTYWGTVKEDVLNADVVALATKLSADSATLQATFQTFARINSLKLSDYLR